MNSQLRNPEKKSLLMKSLDFIEKTGNMLPDPIVLFVLLAFIVMVVSMILSWIGISVEDPLNPGQNLEVLNLLSADGIEYVFSSIVTNFTHFAPLGTVLVVMLGIGVVEQTGLLSTSLQYLVMSVPKKMITATLIFSAVFSSVAADAGYVVLIPLGAILFMKMGRHPIAGIAAAFAGVSGGFSANIAITSLDPLLGGITQMAIKPFDPEYAANFNIAGNFFFMFASVFLIVIVGTFVTEKIVEPRLGKYIGEKVSTETKEITDLEKKGMKLALISLIITFIFLSLLVVPSWGPLRGDEGITNSPFLSYIVVPLLIAFLVPGITYGVVTKSIRSSNDLAQQFTTTMANMSGFIVLAFTAGQFVSFFIQSNLGTIMAIKGVDLLQVIGLTGLPLILLFMVICGVINLFIGSASAKWALMAPVFVPIMMEMGYTPEFTQLVYRIADSSTNMITPLMAYFAMVVAFANKYDKKLGIGTLISTMIPYSFAFSLFWILLLIVWMVFGWNIGPGTGIFLP